MEGSGLEDLWATVYARGSIPKMMEGKAYTKCLRACLLTNAALHLTLLKSTVAVDADVELGDDIVDMLEGFSEEDQDFTEIQITESESNTADQITTEGQTVGDFIRSLTDTDTDNLLGDDLNAELGVLYDNLTQNVASIDDMDDNASLQQLFNKVSTLKDIQQSSRTGKLWLQFTEFVSIVQMFIRAERIGDWNLQLKATQDMLSFFAAAGHNNYAKCCRLYLQDCNDLCPCLVQAMEDGQFTIRRNPHLLWSGTWSDMTIEQCLMRAGKTQGGLINITHKEAAKTKWLLTAHVIAQYTEAIRSLTETFTGTWSEQHREVHPGHIKNDLKDLKTFQTFLESHNPFTTTDCTQLRNISTGVIADARVNVDDAKSIGIEIHNQLTDQRYGDITMKKSNQAQTFAVMRKSVKVDGEEVRMGSAELHQRLLSIACTSGPPNADVFKYELATVPPALFQDDGSMRKCQK